MQDITPPPDNQVLRYLTGARWFAGKGRQPSLLSVTPLPWLTGENEFVGTSTLPAVRFEVAEIGYPDGPVEYYQLAVSYRANAHPDLRHAEIGSLTIDDLGPAHAYDAAQDPQACRVILGALLAGRMLRGPDTSVHFHGESAGRGRSDGSALTTELEPRVFTGQQSNTSVMFGDVAMLKLFRRLELGRNLDIEVHHALNAAGITDVAGLFGWVEGSWVAQSGPGASLLLQADLAMVVEKLPDATDGWGFALDRLSRGRSFAAEAESLGRSLAGIHASLHDAFPAGRVLGATTAAVMEERLDQAAAIRLLTAYEADKAIYEVVYETRNRPDWVSIPLGAITKLAGPPGPDASETPTDQISTDQFNAEEQRR